MQRGRVNHHVGTTEERRHREYLRRTNRRRAMTAGHCHRTNLSRTHRVVVLPEWHHCHMNRHVVVTTAGPLGRTFRQRFVSPDGPWSVPALSAVTCIKISLVTY